VEIQIGCLKEIGSSGNDLLTDLKIHTNIDMNPIYVGIRKSMMALILCEINHETDGGHHYAEQQNEHAGLSLGHGRKHVQK